MPQHKSCKKRIKSAAKARIANRAMKSRVLTATKKVRAAGADDAQKLLSNAYSVLDKAVKSGVIHKNKAANQKAKLAKAIAKA